MTPKARAAFLCGFLTACATTPAVAPRSVAQQAMNADAPEVTWVRRPDTVQVRARVVAPDTEAPREALERAKAEARGAAASFVAGVEVKTGVVDFAQWSGATASELLQSFTATQVHAVVVSETVMDSWLEPLGTGGYRQGVVLQVRVLDRSAARDGGFRTEVQMERSRLLEGESLHVRVRATRDARIYLINVAENGAFILLPNVHAPDAMAQGGQWMEFPDDSLRQRGVRLTAELPQGRESAREGLLVIAVRPQHRLEGLVPAGDKTFVSVEGDRAGQSLAALLTPLFSLPPDDWTFDQLTYEILKK